MHPLVSVLVLNYRNPGQTVLCVESLLKQTINTPSPLPSPSPFAKATADRQGGGKNGMEIIVIDNHSQDDSIGVLRNRLLTCAVLRDAPPCLHAEVRRSGTQACHGEGFFESKIVSNHHGGAPQDDTCVPSIRIIETPLNLGFGAGYNFGARYAHGLYLLINNPAKMLERCAIERMIQRMDADTNIGILAPKIVHADFTRRLSTRTFPSPLDVIAKRTILKKIFKKRMHRYLQTDAEPDKDQDVDWVIGGCFMIRNSLFRHLHGFDERFFLFFEDIDLCRRVHMANQRVMYNPFATAVDRKERLSGEGFWDLFFSRTGRIHLISAGKYFWKWGMAS